MYDEWITRIETIEHHGDELLPAAALEALGLPPEALAESLSALGYQGPAYHTTEVPEGLYYTRPLGIAASLSTKGHKAAVALPRFGQAHQQYFTPAWLAQAMEMIARRLYDKVETHFDHPLVVLDPTAGSGRLLAPFAAVGHQCQAHLLRPDSRQAASRDREKRRWRSSAFARRRTPSLAFGDAVVRGGEAQRRPGGKGRREGKKVGG